MAWTRIANSRTESLVNTPLVVPEKVYLLPLHIELGLKSFVLAVDQNSAGFVYWNNRFVYLKPRFVYLKPRFPSLSDAKIKKGYLLGLKQESCGSGSVVVSLVA